MKSKRKPANNANPAVESQMLFVQARKSLQNGSTDKFQELYRKLLEYAEKLREQGNRAPAADCYRKALALQPRDYITRNELGNLLVEQDGYASAIACYRQAVEVQPDYSDGYFNLGYALKQQGNLMEAIAAYRQAIAYDPVFVEAYFNLGNALREKGMLSEAVEVLEKAAALKPDYADVYYNLAKLYDEQGDLAKSVEYYQKALANQQDMAQAYYNMGMIAEKEERFEDAIACYRKALTIRPDYPECYNNIGSLLQGQGKLDEAKRNYLQAIAINSDEAYAAAHWNLALTYLLSGDFENGFREYEWRFHTGDAPELSHIIKHVPRWQGENFAGKRLLVISEQGLGDCIQFIRYLPMVKARGGTVAFFIRQSLGQLFAGFPGVDELVVYMSDEAALSQYDLIVPLLSLPLVFETRVDTVPSDIPYLTANAAKMKHWYNTVANAEYKVGLVWAANPDNKRGLERTCGLRALQPLAGIPGVTFYSLQKGEAAREVAPAGMTMVDTSGGLHDFSDTAALIANLDLVITVDTSVAHLAGALGKPVWTLLPFAADWRWMLEREDTPWYPNMKLFRQKNPGNWEELAARVAAELTELVKSH